MSEHTSLLPQTQGSQAGASADGTTDTYGTRRESPAKDPFHTVSVDRTALLCLLLQHVSSSFGASMFNFGGFMILAEIFQDTLAPASLFGFSSTLSSILFSGYVGSLIDRTGRLKYVRTNIVVEKILQIITYSLFLVLLGPLKSVASPAFRGDAPMLDIVLIWSVLCLSVLIAGIAYLCSTGLEVAIQRDWVTTISQCDGALLSKLNSYFRIITFSLKVIPPIILSILVYPLGYPGAVVTLIVGMIVSLFAEYQWIKVVYNRFPILRTDEGRKISLRGNAALGHAYPRGNEDQEPSEDTTPKLGLWRRCVIAVQDEANAWREFAGMPIFFAALSTSTRFMGTLTMDGVGMSYFKIARGWDEGSLGLIRCGSIGMYLFGALSLQPIERNLGTSQTVLLSTIASALMCAVAVAAFFLDPGIHLNAPMWDSIMMLSGIILARFGVATSGLALLKQLQLSLASHPQRNRLTAFQEALNDFFGLLKYVMVFVFSKPEQFKWTTAVTLMAECACIAFYVVYMVKTRGR